MVGLYQGIAQTFGMAVMHLIDGDMTFLRAVVVVLQKAVITAAFADHERIGEEVLVGPW